MDTYRKVVTFQWEADDLFMKTADVFKRLGIQLKEQNEELCRVMGVYDEGSTKAYTVQASFLPIDDSTAVLIYASALVRDTIGFHFGEKDPPPEFDRIFNDYLAALRDTLGAEQPLDSKALTVIDNIQNLPIQTAKGYPCTLILTPAMAIFTDPETGHIYQVQRELARNEITFLADNVLGVSIESGIASVSGVSFDVSAYKQTLTDWFPPLPYYEMKLVIRNWGAGLLLMGVASLVLSSFLDARWGIMLIGLGVFNYIFIHRFIFIINGAVLIIAGILNIISTVISITSAGSVTGIWVMFGVFQLLWGAAEIMKFSKYRNTSKSA